MNLRPAAVLAILGLATISVGLLLIMLRGGVAASLEPTSNVEIATNHAERAAVVLDDRRQQLSGVRVARAIRGTLHETLPAVGVVTYDETRLADVNLKLEGWIRDLYINFTGQRVEKDQPLFTLESSDLALVQTQLVAALKNRDQLPAAATGEQTDFANRLVDTPRQRLLRWNVPEDQLRVLEEKREILAAVVFRSPAAGVVLEKTAVQGMHVEPGKTLYKLADLSVVWVDAEFHETDVSRLRPGSEAVVRVDAWPDERFVGRIAYVDPSVTAQSQSVRARIELPNRLGRLKPGMFANVEVTAIPREGLLVPEDAVVDSGTRQVVFVAQGSGHFEPRDVNVRDRSEGQALVLNGLREGEEVVTRATFLIDAESHMRAALQSYATTTATHSAASQADAHVSIRINSTPDPLKTGTNIVDVQVHDAVGRPVTDVDVQLLFSMSAMPTMNMPAMRAAAHLAQVERGLYRGPVVIPMTGSWDVVVTAMRGNQLIATTNTTWTAR